MKTTLPFLFILLLSGPTRAHVQELIPYAGWQIQPQYIETNWPLPDRYEQTFEIETPENTTKFRINFPWIMLEEGYDFLIIQDEDGNEIERITGFHTNYLSKAIHGNRTWVKVITDEDVNSMGFAIDYVLHRGCQANEVGTGELVASPRCSDLAYQIQDMAIKQVRRIFDGSFYWFRPLREKFSADGAPAHSETNVQVQGVDEADIVKTDGTHTYLLRGEEVLVYTTWPIDETHLQARIPIEGRGREMFLLDDRLVVLSSVYLDAEDSGQYGGQSYTKVTEVQLGDEPQVNRQLLLPGWYHTARRIDNSIRLVMRKELNWPDFRTYPEGVEYGTREYDDALEQLETQAVLAVLQQPLDQWLQFPYQIVDQERVRIPIRCDQFLAPKDADGLNIVSVTTIKLDPQTATFQDTALMLNADQIVQSHDNLYLAQSHRWSCQQDAGLLGQYTYVHKLSVVNPQTTTYQASGVVEGSVLDQFSMDEYEGNLRIATTSNFWQIEDPEQRTKNQVFILGQNGNRLETLGQVEIHAPGERIMSARFMGTRGFVVTFRQVDPLFTLDLSDPRDPQVIGELTVPGFSTYLHPLDEDHLFSIGHEFEEDGQTRIGVALSIFNVADLAQPRLVTREIVGTQRGYSNALFEHHAFSMFTTQSGKTVLAIPFTDYTLTEDGGWSWRNFTSALKVFEIKTQSISALGELEHASLFEQQNNYSWSWRYQPTIQRGLFIDDYVIAISHAGVSAAPIENPNQTIMQLPAPAPESE